MNTQAMIAKNMIIRDLVYHIAYWEKELRRYQDCQVAPAMMKYYQDYFLQPLKDELNLRQKGEPNAH